MERYEYIGQAGSGAYGQVWVCRVRPLPQGEEAVDGLQEGMLVACKVFRQAHTDKEIMRLALREVRVLKAINHSNCVRLLDAFKSKSGKVYLIFEYVEGCAYKELCKYRMGLPAKSLKLLAFQLCLSLRYLHGEKIVHRDLKPSNILIDNDGRVKLCDFGFARFTSCTDPRDAERMSSYVVTRWYRAPEVLLSMEYGPPSDIWALGCTIAELAVGEPLMPGTSTVDQLWRVMRIFGSLPPRMAVRITQDARLTALRVPPRGRPLAVRLHGIGPRLIQFLEACLQLDPLARPTADELLRMPYFFEIRTLVAGTPLESLVMRELQPAMARRPAAAAAAVAPQAPPQPASALPVQAPTAVTSIAPAATAAGAVQYKTAAAVAAATATAAAATAAASETLAASRVAVAAAEAEAGPKPVAQPEPGLPAAVTSETGPGTPQPLPPAPPTTTGDQAPTVPGSIETSPAASFTVGGASATRGTSAASLTSDPTAGMSPDPGSPILAGSGQPATPDNPAGPGLPSSTTGNSGPALTVPVSLQAGISPVESVASGVRAGGAEPAAAAGPCEPDGQQQQQPTQSPTKPQQQAPQQSPPQGNEYSNSGAGSASTGEPTFASVIRKELIVLGNRSIASMGAVAAGGGTTDNNTSAGMSGSSSLRAAAAALLAAAEARGEASAAMLAACTPPQAGAEQQPSLQGWGAESTHLLAAFKDGMDGSEKPLTPPLPPHYGPMLKPPSLPPLPEGTPAGRVLMNPSELQRLQAGEWRDKDQDGAGGSGPGGASDTCRVLSPCSAGTDSLAHKGSSSGGGSSLRRGAFTHAAVNLEPPTLQPLPSSGSKPGGLLTLLPPVDSGSGSGCGSVRGLWPAMSSGMDLPGLACDVEEWKPMPRKTARGPPPPQFQPPIELPVPQPPQSQGLQLQTSQELKTTTSWPAPPHNPQQSSGPLRQAPAHSNTQSPFQHLQQQHQLQLQPRTPQQLQSQPQQPVVLAQPVNSSDGLQKARSQTHRWQTPTSTSRSITLATLTRGDASSFGHTADGGRRDAPGALPRYNISGCARAQVQPVGRMSLYGTRPMPEFGRSEGASGATASAAMAAGDPAPATNTQEFLLASDNYASSIGGLSANMGDLGHVLTPMGAPQLPSCTEIVYPHRRPHLAPRPTHPSHPLSGASSFCSGTWSNGCGGMLGSTANDYGTFNLLHLVNSVGSPHGMLGAGAHATAVASMDAVARYAKSPLPAGASGPAPAAAQLAAGGGSRRMQYIRPSISNGVIVGEYDDAATAAALAGGVNAQSACGAVSSLSQTALGSIPGAAAGTGAATAPSSPGLVPLTATAAATALLSRQHPSGARRSDRSYTSSGAVTAPVHQTTYSGRDDSEAGPHIYAMQPGVDSAAAGGVVLGVGTSASGETPLEGSVADGGSLYCAPPAMAWHAQADVRRASYGQAYASGSGRREIENGSASGSPSQQQAVSGSASRLSTTWSCHNPPQQKSSRLSLMGSPHDAFPQGPAPRVSMGGSVTVQGAGGVVVDGGVGAVRSQSSAIASGGGTTSGRFSAVPAVDVNSPSSTPTESLSCKQMASRAVPLAGSAVSSGMLRSQLISGSKQEVAPEAVRVRSNSGHDGSGRAPAFASSSSPSQVGATGKAFVQGSPSENEDEGKEEEDEYNVGLVYARGDSASNATAGVSGRGNVRSGKGSLLQRATRKLKRIFTAKGEGIDAVTSRAPQPPK